ncbi:MAG: hypothetical protein LBT04_00905 [Prevotellaceae bacterium]|nr:hypothetical protein [Prevotellaceae bacterium]
MVKKLVVAVALVATVGMFSSCKDKVGCWKVSSVGMTVGYFYGTKADAQAKYSKLMSYKKVDKSEADCKAEESLL